MIKQEMLKRVQYDCWFSRHCEFISESNTEESMKQVQHDRWFSRHSELVSESNTEEMLKRVQHGSWVKIVGCMECTNKKYI